MIPIISTEILEFLKFLPDPAFIINNEGIVVGWNEPMEKITGILEENILGKGDYEYALPFYGKRRPMLIDLVSKSEKDIKQYYSLVDHHGTSLIGENYLPKFNNGSHFEIKAKPLHNQKGEVIGAIEILKDITESVQAEVMLAENEEKFSAFFHDSMDAILITNIEGKITECNQKALKLLGFSRENLYMKPFHEFFHATKQQVSTQQFFQILDVDHVQFETQLTKKNKSVIYVEIQAIKFEVGQKQMIQCIIRDITVRKLAENNLIKSREQLAVTLRVIGDGVITTDTNGKIVLINKVAENLTGWTQEEAIGKDIMTVFKIIDTVSLEPRENPIKRAIKNGGFEEYIRKTSLISKTGNSYSISESGKLILDKQSQIQGIVIVFHDITEKQKMEEIFYKNQKIESIGVLAGGIAHDFNNFLTTILGNLTIAQTSGGDNSDLQEILEEAEKACIRARDLTKQLLTFSKGGAPIKEITTIQELILDTTNFTLRGTKCAKKITFQDNLWSVDIDKGQISQVLNNILINAEQAMPNGGTIVLDVKNIISAPHQKPFLAKNQKFLHISIKDDGIGIPNENLSRIFDPYFSTKETGNGLGLAVSYSIIKNHGGALIVESEVGKGTAVSIYLPAVENIKKSDSNVRFLSTPKSGKVLVMDDDPTILEVLEKMLIHLGYQPVKTTTGEELLDIFMTYQKQSENISAVILDLTIAGGMGGKETMEKLREISPTVNAIVSSGYSNDPIMANYSAFGFKNLLVKPFTINELKNALLSLNQE
ncbi:PAS domain S-box protein [Candidatus Lokiarchaeum ossiferum]|uniref:PAS domain S-box protein n=1 Tax=Candidatus Lokiarchaeum ossiferum TaxID=2951803 RepID=UPI00352E426E